MLKRFRLMLAARRRRRSMLTIRKEFARCGYPLDGLADAEIEASLPPETVADPASRLGAKTISRALRRLLIDTRRQCGGEAAEVVGRPEYSPPEGGAEGAPPGLAATRSGMRSTRTRTSGGESR